MTDVTLTVSTNETPPSCTVTIANGAAVFEGNYYEYHAGVFHPVRQGRVAVSARKFLGIGYLKKRSDRRRLVFLAAVALFSLLGSLSDKLGYLVFLNTDWLTALMNGVLIVSVLAFVYFLFSGKDVVEISFVGKRICIDRKRLTAKDVEALQRGLRAASKRP